MSTMRIAIACGGTGGHLFPGIAVAESLNAKGHQVLLLVSSKQIDAVALRQHPEFQAMALPSVGWPGLTSPKVFRFVFKLLQARRECRRLFKEFQPTAVLGMGGFTSAVPLSIGRRLKVPTFLHESNAIPGRVTRLLAGRVTKVFLGFERCAKGLGGAEISVTGTPVRKGLDPMSREEAAQRLGLDASRKTILIMGGSQGARGVNEVLLKTLPKWEEFRDQWQFIHLTGDVDANIVEINYRRSRLQAWVKSFSGDMGAIYSLSDLALSRAGAGSLTELSAFGIPSVLVPFPTAAEDHQTRNAEIFVEHGAAELYPQSRLSPENLDETVRGILLNPERHQSMSEAARKMNRSEAACRIVEEIERCRS